MGNDSSKVNPATQVMSMAENAANQAKNAIQQQLQPHAAPVQSATPSTTAKNKATKFCTFQPPQSKDSGWLQPPNMAINLPGSDTFMDYCAKHPYKLHDIFIAAYGDDNIVAEKIANSLQGKTIRKRPIRVYFNKQWASESWMCPFHSSVVIIFLISEQLLNAIQDLKGAPSEHLLAFEVALFNVAASRALIFPFFVESADAKPMKFPDMNKFVATKHSHPLSIDPCPQHTMRNMFQLQARQLSLQKYSDRIGDVLEVLGKAYEQHIYAGPLDLVSKLSASLNRYPPDTVPYVASFHIEAIYSDPTYFQVCLTNVLTSEMEYSFNIPNNKAAWGKFGKAIISPDLTSVVVYWQAESPHYKDVVNSKIEKWVVATGEAAWDREFPKIMDTAFYGEYVLVLCAASNGYYDKNLIIRVLAVKTGSPIAVCSVVTTIYGDSMAYLTAGKDYIALSYLKSLSVWAMPTPLPTADKPIAPLLTKEFSEYLGRVVISKDDSMLALATESNVQVLYISAPKSFPFLSLVQDIDVVIQYKEGWTGTASGLLAFSTDSTRLFLTTPDSLKIYNLVALSEERVFRKPRERLSAPYLDGDFLRNGTGAFAICAREIDFWSFESPDDIRLTQCIYIPTMFRITTAAFAAVKATRLPYEKSSKPQALESLKTRTVAVAKHLSDNGTEVSVYESKAKMLAVKHKLSLPDKSRDVKHVAIAVQAALLLIFSDKFIDGNTEARVIEAYDIYGKGGFEQAPVYTVTWTFESHSFPQNASETYITHDGATMWILFRVYDHPLLVSMDLATGKFTRAIRMAMNVDGTSLPHNTDVEINKVVFSTDNTKVLSCCAKGLWYRNVNHVLGLRCFDYPKVSTAAFLNNKCLCCFVSEGRDSFTFLIADYLTGHILHHIDNTAVRNVFQGFNDSFWMQFADYHFEFMKAETNQLVSVSGFMATKYANLRGNFKVSKRSVFLLDEYSISFAFSFTSSTGRESESAVIIAGLGEVLAIPLDADTQRNDFGAAGPISSDFLASTKEVTDKQTDDYNTQLLLYLGFTGRNTPAVSASVAKGSPTKSVDKRAPDATSAVASTQSAAATATAPAATTSIMYPLHTWKCKCDKVLVHDVFISYRVWCDKELSMKLALNLRHQIKQNGCNEPVVVFLDRLCLQDGEDWECGFLNGLNHSSLVVLLISKNTFLGIQEADKRQDNVLLEYEYALRMAEKKQIVLLPLMINNEDNSPCVFPDLSVFPAGPHASKKTSYASVRETMKCLRDNFTSYPIAPDDKFQDATETILRHLNEAESLGLHRYMRSKALLVRPNDMPTLVTAYSSTSPNQQTELTLAPITNTSSTQQKGTTRRTVPLPITEGDIIHVTVSPNPNHPIAYFTLCKLYDWYLYAWDVNTNQKIFMKELDRKTVLGMVLSRDGEFIVTSSKHAFAVMRTKDGHEISKVYFNEKNKDSDELTDFDISADNRYFFGCSRGAFVAYELRSKSLILTRRFRGFVADKVSVSLIGRRFLLTGKCDDNAILVLKCDPVTGLVTDNPMTVYELKGNTSAVSIAVFSPSGSYVASINQDGHLRIYTVDNCQLLWEKQKFASPKSSLSFSRNDKVLACVLKGTSTVACVDVPTGIVVSQDSKESSAFFCF